MHKRRVQSAENTKRIFSMKFNNLSKAQQVNNDQKLISQIFQNTQSSNLNSSIKIIENNIISSKIIDDQSALDNSMRGAYNVTNYYAEPKIKIQSQNNSLDIIRNQQVNENSPKSQLQKKCKIIMKRKINAFPQDFFSSTLGANKNTVRNNDLSYQLHIINQEGKFVDQHENQKKTGIVNRNTEKLNHSIGSINFDSLKKQELEQKDIFQRSSQIKLSGSNIIGVIGKHYPSNAKKCSVATTKKLNSESTCQSSVSTSLSSEKQLQKSQIISASQNEPQQNMRTSTPKFNVFEGIHPRSNSISCSQIPNKVQQLNLNEMIKYNTNTVCNSVVLNPNDQQGQNEFLHPIETNRSIQSESQNSKTQQCLHNISKLKPPKPVQQHKQSNNKQQSAQQYNSISQENYSQQKENHNFQRENSRSYSFQVESSKQTACFQDLINKNCNVSNPTFDEGNLQFSDNNFQIQNFNKRNSLQYSNIAEQKYGYQVEGGNTIQIKQRNSLQKFISQEDKIPVVFRQMLIPKKARPNSHNNQQIQLRDKCNIMNKIKEKLGSNNSITLKELDQIFEDSQINENNKSLNQSRKLNLKETSADLHQNKNIKFVILRQNNNLKKFENTISNISKEPLNNKIYNNNNTNHQQKAVVKRRSFSLQKQESTNKDILSNINRDQIQQAPKSQEHLLSNQSNDQKRDLFEFSFSKLTNENDINDKQPSNFQVQVEQFKINDNNSNNNNDKNVLMDSTFNPNYFKCQGWVDKQNSIKQSNLQNELQGYNKENINQERERSQTLNGTLNKKSIQSAKRVIFDAKPEMCFNSQLMNIQINQQNNLLNSQSFKNNVNK